MIIGHNQILSFGSNKLGSLSTHEWNVASIYASHQFRMQLYRVLLRVKAHPHHRAC